MICHILNYCNIWFFYVKRFYLIDSPFIYAKSYSGTWMLLFAELILFQDITLCIYPDTVNKPSQQHHIHTEIQPQHHKNDRRHTSVQTGKSFEDCQIHWKNKRDHQPSQRTENRSQNQIPERKLPVRQKVIYQKRNSSHNNKWNHRSQTHDHIRRLRKKRNFMIYKNTDIITKHRKYQSHHNCCNEQDRIDGCPDS